MHAKPSHAGGAPADSPIPIGIVSGVTTLSQPPTHSLPALPLPLSLPLPLPLPLNPCRQRICASENWGFTKLQRDQYTALKGLGQLIKNGVDVKVAKVKGPLGPNELQKLPMSMLGGDEE